MEPQQNVFALVIDDDPIQYELTKAILTLEGYPVLTADNAQEGLELSNRYHPFVIITDYSMPDIDGAELIERLKASVTADTSVLIVSAYPPEYVEQQLRPGCRPDLILPKPVDYDLLVQTVRNLHQPVQEVMSCVA
ncbi:MAG TPA: response regulator [Blastocatellia bacterium]|nr:response regulator [Blastocatellia bacterium]